MSRISNAACVHDAIEHAARRLIFNPIKNLSEIVGPIPMEVFDIPAISTAERRISFTCTKLLFRRCTSCADISHITGNEVYSLLD
jgi:hypothetical protein